MDRSFQTKGGSLLNKSRKHEIACQKQTCLIELKLFPYNQSHTRTMHTYISELFIGGGLNVGI